MNGYPQAPVRTPLGHFEAGPEEEVNPMMYILMWLLGVPATLLIILFLLGVGR
jgi:hypothetical protein